MWLFFFFFKICVVHFWVLLGGGVWDHLVCLHMHAETLWERLEGSNELGVE